MDEKFDREEKALPRLPVTEEIEMGCNSDQRSKTLVPQETTNPLSGLFIFSCIISLPCIGIAIADTIFFPQILLPLNELPTLPVALIYLYIGSFALKVCQYIRGLGFKFIQPVSDCRYDLLQCLQQNMRSWAQYTANFWERERGFEKRITSYQKTFAWYLACPAFANKGIEYWRSCNLGAVILIFWAHYLLCRAVYILAHVFVWEELVSLKGTATGCIIFMAVIFVLLQVMFLDGFMHSTAARYGRGLRMAALAEQIRDGRFSKQEDVETAEAAKEKLLWWLDKLVRNSSDSPQEEERERKTIENMLLASRL
jgi:hypothetical protein